MADGKPTHLPAEGEGTPELPGTSDLVEGAAQAKSDDAAADKAEER